MGRIGVSEYQVYQAAEQLAADGLHPSVDSVRVELGNTGSRTTINKYLKEWRARRAHRDQAGANLNGHLLQVLTEQSEIILSALEKASAAEFQAKSQQYESQIKAQNEQLQQKTTEINQYQIQLQSLQAQFDKQHIHLQQIQSELIDSRDDNQALRESLAKEVGRRETLDGALADRDRQQAMIQKEFRTLQTRHEILSESQAGKMAEIQLLQRREQEQRTVLKEKTDEIKQLSQALKNEQQLRGKEIGRLTLSINQLMRSSPGGKTAGAQKTKKS